jgi:5'-deoxynucleotidase YfbR-like HD superfamily hydrolase
MENIIEKSKNRNLQDDPQYFGGYLNMARHNIMTISNHIANRLGNGVKPLDDEEKIETSFLCDKSTKKVNWNLAFDIGVRFLPIIKVFDFERLPKADQNFELNYGKDFISMSDTLKNIFGEITEFRNDYSHYYSTAKGESRKIEISETLAAFLQINFQRAIDYCKIRFNGVLQNEDYELASTKILVDEENNITQFGLIFLISMFLEREQAFQFIGKISGLKGTQYSSFIATREVLMTFCVKLPHDRFVSDDRQQAFSLDIINELNKCPKVLYNVITEDARKQFKPKLDEISKLNLLTNSSPDSDEFIDNYDDYIEALTKRIRYNDRFSDFALKFIDEMNILPSWMFQINLGKLVLDKYPKRLNGEEVERTVLVEPNAFGKLSSFDNQDDLLGKIRRGDDSVLFVQFSPYYNINNNKIGLALKKSHALVIAEPDTEKQVKKRLKQPQPEAFLSLHELPKIILLEYLKKGEAERLIHEFIKTNNEKLINKDFIDEIKAKMPDDWNEFYRRQDSKKSSAYPLSKLEYLHYRKEELNKVLADYGLNDKQIPSRILDFWLEIKDVDTKRSVSEQIKQMKRDCIERLKAIQKYRKKGEGRIPKIGEMATFLAKDIVDMVIGEDKKKKITSFYYDKIQECLALFAVPEKKQLFIDIITNDLKLNESDGHPFLKNINFSELKYTTDLYEKYLIEKGYKLVKGWNQQNVGKDQSWMAKQFYTLEWNEQEEENMTVVKLPSNLSLIPLSIRKLIEEKSTIDEWLNNITKGKTTSDKKKPIDLPTNLFDDTLCSLLGNEINVRQPDFCEASNYNKLFKIWWDFKGDSTQPFYNAEREYTIYNERINFTINSKNKFADYYQDALYRAFRNKQKERIEEKKINSKLPNIDKAQIEQTFKHVLGQTEKEIRIIQEHDRLLLLMLVQMIDENSVSELKLSEAEILLDKTILLRQTVTGELSFDTEGEIIKDRKQKETISKAIVVNRKRKNYGTLHRFVFDKRLPELFDYFDGNEIEMEVLKRELDTYDRAKQVVFDKAFELEKKLILKDTDGIQQLLVNDEGQKAEGSIQHEPYLNWLKQHELIDEDEFAFLKMVRNTFSHNQFPQKRTMDKTVKWEQPSEFAVQIAEIYAQKIDGIVARL